MRKIIPTVLVLLLTGCGDQAPESSQIFQALNDAGATIVNKHPFDPKINIQYPNSFKENISISIANPDKQGVITTDSARLFTCDTKSNCNPIVQHFTQFCKLDNSCYVSASGKVFMMINSVDMYPKTHQIIKQVFENY